MKLAQHTSKLAAFQRFNLCTGVKVDLVTLLLVLFTAALIHFRQKLSFVHY